MKACIRERSSRKFAWRDPRALQPVSRIVGPRPNDFIRLRAWTAPAARLNNGISAVTSLCLVDESDARGPPVIIIGDEDGNVGVERVPVVGTSSDEGQCRWSSVPNLRGTQLHVSGINTIKLLPDARGFVCASDDGVLSAVATLEAHSGSDLQRATLTLHGHSSFVTDCDTTTCGHGIVSCSNDGRMFLWDPVAGNKPVMGVSVGRPINSVCFSAGDPYALLCAPGRPEVHNSEGSRDGSQGDELIQIWDLRYLTCFRDKIPCALAEAFGEDNVALSTPGVEPPRSPTPRASTSSASCGGNVNGSKLSGATAARAPVELPSWLTSRPGFSSLVASPPTPLLRRSVWEEDVKDAALSPASLRRADTGSLGVLDNPKRSSRDADNLAKSVARDVPATVLRRTLLPQDTGCLHLGPEGKIWVPGTLLRQWGTRRARLASRRRTEFMPDPEAHGSLRTPPKSNSKVASCDACPDVPGRIASVYSVQVTPDGRGILTASRDKTITLWDTQSKEVVYRFGHARLSTRARPVLSGVEVNSCRKSWKCNNNASRSGCASNMNSGEVFAGLTDGEVRAWRLRSRFPNRVFKPVQLHKGFEVTCLASSRDGVLFASADSSGKISVQSAVAAEATGS